MESSSHSTFSRRQVLAMAGSAAAIGLTAGLRPLRAEDTPATTQAGGGPPKAKRFKVAGDDEFLNGYRQDLKEFAFAQKVGLDGVSLDMGHMPRGKPYENVLLDPATRQSFLDESRRTGVEIASLAFFALYAHVMPRVPDIATILHGWVDLMAKMDVKLGYMPLMTKDGTLAEPEHAEVWQQSVDLFKQIAPEAEKAGVVLGVESNVDADGYKRFLDAVGSPAVQAFYNPGVGLENKFDVYRDLKDLGKSRVCGLHLEQGSVAPEKFEHRLGDGLIDFKKLRETLLELEWGGWMSIARSRLKGTERKFAPNMQANAKFVHDTFPE